MIDIIYFLPLLHLKDEGYSIETIEKLDREFIKISKTTKKEFGIHQVANKIDMNDLETFKLISLCIQRDFAMIIYIANCPICNKIANKTDHLKYGMFKTTCSHCGRSIAVDEKNMRFTIKLLLGTTIQAEM